MKKRILALLLAMVMVFGLNTTFLAAGSKTEDNTAEVNEMEVAWSDSIPWNIEINNDFELKEGGWLGMYLYLYKDGTLLESFYDNIYYGDGAYFGEHIKDYIQETGEYQVKVTASKIEGGKTVAKYAGETEVAKYVNPGKKLATPANVSIDKDGIVKFDAVDGAAYYEIWYSWYQAATGYEIETDWYVSCGSSNCTVSGNTYAFDLLEYIHDYSNAYDVDYKIKVRAVSSDINVIRHSDFSDEVVYEIRVAADKIEEKFDDKLAAGTSNARDFLVSSVANETLIDMYKTDAEFFKKVADLDEAWKKEQNITVTPKSEIASIDSSKITIVGAALNAGKDANVELTIKEPTTKANVPAGYFNSVQLDINLLIDNESMKELKIPVAITMPIPTGVAKENLVILHYHEEGKEPQIITPVINADGTMTFIVDGFSTFVVANTEADGTGDTDPVGVMIAIMALSAVVAVTAMKKKAVVK